MTRRTVALRIYAQLIAQVLHLDPSMRVIGARTEQHGGHDIIVFSVDCPEAPAGTLEMVPVYQRSPNIPDPVQLVAVEWTLRDGTREIQQLVEPEPEPPRPTLREAHAAYKARKADTADEAAGGEG